MPLGLQSNRELQDSLWRVWRSATRDRVIPSVGPGRVLQRVRIMEALPVGGVMVGAAEALPLDERQRKADALAAQRARALEAIARGGTEIVLQTETFGDSVYKQFPPAAVDEEETWLVGSVKGDGVISQIAYATLATGNVLTGFAIRTEGGMSAFVGSPFQRPGDFGTMPDFMRLAQSNQAGWQVIDVKVPVFAGERIFAVTRMNGLVAQNSELYRLLVTVSYRLEMPALIGLMTDAGVKQTAAQKTAIEREVIRQRTVLAQEAERTRRAQIEAQAKVEVARLAAEAKRPAYSPAFNPFQPLLIAPAAQEALASRAPRPAPPPRLPPPSRAPLEGTGKTFVSAWLPQAGAIGYLVPTPPRGGRVNVFDNKYSIFDITGRLVQQGTVELVRSDAEIPPGARLSPQRGFAAPAEVIETARQLQRELTAPPVFGEQSLI